MRWYVLMAAVIGLMAATDSSTVRAIYIVIAAVLAQHWIRQAIEFEPFTVRIRLLYPLLIEKQLARPELLTKVRTAAGVEDRPYSPLLDGVRFTLLRPGAWSATDTLVFWPDYNRFSTKIETLAELKELEQPATGDAALTGRSTWSPWWELRHAAEGLELCVSSPGSFETKTVTVLPWSVFRIRQWRYGAMSQKRSAAQLARLGWEQRDRNADFPDEPFQLVHPQFRVDWWYI